MAAVLFEKRGRVGVVTLNRPDKLNAANTEMLYELSKLFESKLDCDVLILQGAGQKAFCTGADIKEMAATVTGQFREFARLGQKIARMLEEMSSVTIAAVKGYALGAGFEIALGCDFIYAGKSALFGLPEVKLGLIPGFGGIQRFSRTVGKRRAKELMCTGKMLSAEEAYHFGVVNRIVSDDELLESCLRTAQIITEQSQFAVRQIKQVVDRGFDAPHRVGFELEIERFFDCFDNGDARKMIDDYLTKK